MPRTNDLTVGPIAPRLIRMTGPMVLGMFSMVAFNLADTYFVSQLGEIPLAAIGFTFPVVFLVQSVAIGLGQGTSSCVSRAVGSGDIHRVRRLTTDGLGLGVMLVGLVSAVGVATIDPVFRLLGATDTTLPLIHSYMNTWYFGAVFVVVPMVGNHAMRAGGDTLIPGLIMVAGASINILLDPLLIFGLWGFPEMGMAGAAMATVIARACTLLVSLGILHFRKGMLAIERPIAREVIRSTRDILYVGIPSAATFVLGPISFAMVTRMVAQYGETAVAAVGAGSRVEGLVMMVPVAFCTVMVAFVGQNYGAGRRDRILRAQWIAGSFAMAWGVGSMVVFWLTGRWVAGVFAEADNGGTEVIDRLVLFLHIMPIGYGFRSMSMLASSSLNGINEPVHSAIVSGGRLMLVCIPLAWLGSQLWGLGGLFTGLAVGNVLGGSAAVPWFLAVLKKHPSPRTPPAGVPSISE